ncbi:hypothetical protein SBV1_340048 [Verrucomicrobia bacterium]|nr:hypothetical protein SBV1_340048 [Verrucomicrobiota bacterium]
MAVVAETVVLFTLIFGLRAGWGMKVHRFWCGFLALFLGLFSLVHGPRHLPHIGPPDYYSIFPEELAQDKEIARERAAAQPTLAVPRFDRPLAWYVWGSHLAYALAGPNLSRRRAVIPPEVGPDS